MSGLVAASMVSTGRYAIFHAGTVCGEERWSVEPAADGGVVARGEQVTSTPHPLPSELEWRARLSSAGRLLELETSWRVGTRGVRADHRAGAERWHARIQSGGHTREQEGDFPPYAEVVFGSHVLHTVLLRRYVLEPGAEHEFPALLIGPPFFGVEPARQRLVCTARESRDTPAGRLDARRIELSDPAGAITPFAAWLDEHDVVLESYEDTHTHEPWMRLVEYSRG